MTTVIIWALVLCDVNGCVMVSSIPFFESREACQNYYPAETGWKDGKRIIARGVWQECWSKKIETWQR